MNAIETKTDNEYPVIPKEILDKCNELWEKINEIQGILYLTSETVKDSFISSVNTPTYEQSCAVSSSLSHSVRILAEIRDSLDVDVEMALSKLNSDRRESIVTLSNDPNPRDEFLNYFRQVYPRLIELGKAMREDETKFLKPFYGDDEEALSQAEDRYWSEIPESEKRAIWNFCNCLDD